MRHTTKLLHAVVRTITTVTARQQHASSLSLIASTLNLSPYYEPNENDAVYSNNRKIDSLIKSGRLNSARNLFDEMPVRDVVTYNLMISGNNKYGTANEGLEIYHEMVSDGVVESASTFSSVLSMCSGSRFFEEGIQVHCRVVKFGFGSKLYVGSSLVGFYMQMGFCDLALGLFSELPERNLATWNSVLRGFCEMGRVDQLLELYGEMKVDGVEGNGLTFCYLLRGCGDQEFVDEGRQLHCHVIKFGWAESDIFVANALVDCYSACHALINAKKVFDVIAFEDVISWNSIVSVCADRGLIFDAVELFYMMQSWEKRPSVRSYVGFLNFASRDRDILFGKQIHSYVVKLGLGYESVHIQSALIDMYGKCKDIESSVSVYESVPERTLESCNSLMSSLLQCRFVDDVGEMFGLMVDEGIKLDEVSLSTTLKALSESASSSLASCKLVHCCVIKYGFESYIVVSCSLIDAYSRLGQVHCSQKVFEKIPSPNTICFTSMINGFSRDGQGRNCLEMLERMLLKGLKPDKVTILCVLTGCNHTGLVEEGKLVFDSMKPLYGIDPSREHFSCMADLLGRAAMLEEAERLLQQSPVRDDPVMWSSLLRSCRVHRNEIVGKRVAKVLLDLDPDDFAVYLQISSFFSEIGEFESASQIREVAFARNMTREIGHSLIDVIACP